MEMAVDLGVPTAGYVGTSRRTSPVTDVQACETEGEPEQATEVWAGLDATGGLLVNVHSPAMCVGRNCCLHNPSDHPLTEAPLRWRDDKGTMERVCSHGVGHPDPDDIAYNARAHGRDVSIHGCDGCC